MNTVLMSRKSVLPPSVDVEAAAYLKKIGTKLWKLRVARKEIPDVVARAVNISPRLLEEIESGRFNFKLAILFQLCEYYKVDPDDIVLDRTKKSSRINAI